jgi:hypothetical protein
MTRKHNVSETASVLRLQVRGADPYSAAPLETANLRQNETQFLKRRVFYLFRIPDDRQLQNPRDSTSITKVSFVCSFVWA